MPETAPAAADGRGRAGSSRACRPPRPRSRARSTRFEFHHAALGLYDFVYGDLCDWYLEMIKPRLYADDNRDVVELGAARARRDAGARAPDHPVRHRGDLVAHARRGRPADGPPLPRGRRRAARRGRRGARSRARSPPRRSCAAGATASAPRPARLVPARLEAPGLRPHRRARRAARARRVVGRRRRAGRDRRRPRRQHRRARVRGGRRRGRGRARRAPSGRRSRRRSPAPRASSPTRASSPRRPPPWSRPSATKLERLKRELEDL